jgi:hypothetical protein
MRIAHRIRIAVVTAALAAGSGAGHAGVPPKGSAGPPDEGLLEFLGSVDPADDATKPDGGAWLAYLSQVSIGKVAKASQAAQQPPTPAEPKPASASAGAGKPGG